MADPKNEHKPAAHGPLTQPIPDTRVEIPPDQLATAPSGPPLLGGKQVNVVIGPYAGRVLTMPEAEADQAVADKWALEMTYAPIDPNAPPITPLTDAEKQSANEAAQAWSDAQTAPPPEEPDKPGGGPPSRRAMQAGQPGAYETRAAQPAPPPRNLKA